MTGALPRVARLLIALAFVGSTLAGMAAAADVLVIVDADVRDSPIGIGVLEGIERTLGADAVLRRDAEDGVRVRGALERATAAIVLGRTAIESSDTLALPAARAGGAFVGSPPKTTSLPLVSLEIAPATLFAELDKVAPEVVRVRTVATGAVDADYLERAARAARARGIALEIVHADGIRAIARAWRELLAASEATRDAVWLLDDTGLAQGGGYRFVLEKTWQRNLLLVTTLPAYVRRGVALGFVPDLPAYGELLVRVARERGRNLPGPTRTRYLRLASLYRVLNERTLRHVGARLPADLDRIGRDDLVIR